MARFHLACRLLAAVSFLAVGRSLDSINLDLEVLDMIPLDALGIDNLDRHSAKYDVTVDEDTCTYTLQVDFKKHASDTPGDASNGFSGVCSPEANTGNAPDGKPWHAHRRHWMQFPEYVEETTGFNHMSLMWRPCGLPPKGWRQPRYEMNLYTVLPQYRTMMQCQTFKTPEICQYNQSSWLGRGHFSVPRLERDPNFLANMPVNFQPDALEPEAYEYEGLISFSEDQVASQPESWVLPTFEMSTYDGDVVSWRALLPYKFINGGNSSVFNANHYYVHQTMPRLPSHWNTTYDGSSGLVSVFVQGSAGMCGVNFDRAKQASEEAEAENGGGRGLRG
jgi:hypothetical protein